MLKLKKDSFHLFLICLSEKADRKESFISFHDSLMHFHGQASLCLVLSKEPQMEIPAETSKSLGCSASLS